jgi:hypothetical protein
MHRFLDFSVQAHLTHSFQVQRCPTPDFVPIMCGTRNEEHAEESTIPYPQQYP